MSTTVNSLGVINGTATIGADSTVTQDVVELNSTVTVDPGATVGGQVRSLAGDVTGIGVALGVLGVLGVLAAVAFTLVTWAAGLALASFGARQVRTAEWLISPSRSARSWRAWRCWSCRPSWRSC